MTEDAAIRIDFDSAEFVHVTHTMEFFLRPTPRNLSHRILGTRPCRSELEFSNETRLPRYLPTDSPTSCLGYPLWLGVLCYHSSSTVIGCPLLPPQSPATLWQLVQLGPRAYSGSQDYHHLPDQGSVRDNLPYLVMSAEKHYDSPSQGLPIQANVAARISSVRWHLINLSRSISPTVNTSIRCNMSIRS